MFKFYWDVQKSTSKFTVTFKNKNIMKSVDFIEVIQIIKYQDGGQRRLDDVFKKPGITLFI